MRADTKKHDEELDYFVSPSVLDFIPNNEAAATRGVETKTVAAESLDGALGRCTDAPVTLVLGSAGAGKTLVAHMLWRSVVESETARIPVLLELKRFSKADLQVGLEAILREYEGLRPDAVAELRDGKRGVLLILDGYDELTKSSDDGDGDERKAESRDNLYAALKLNEWPSIRVIMTCRARQVRADDLDRICAVGERRHETIYLLPFTSTQVAAYLDKRVSSAEERRRLNKTIADLGKDMEEILRTPFVLRLFVDVFPAMRANLERRRGELSPYEYARLSKVHRSRIYEQFVRQWFAEKIKLRHSHTKLALDEALFWRVSCQLAFAMLRTGRLQVDSITSRGRTRGCQRPGWLSRSK